LNTSIDRLPTRWWGAGRLDARVFTEVAADANALAQAALIVGVGGAARGVGVFAQDGWIGVAGSPAIGVIVWLVGAVLAWGIAARWVGSGASFPEVLRAIGFAASPLVLLALCGVLWGTVRSLWWVVVHLWATLAFAVALRAVLNVSPARAIVVCIAALGIALLLLTLSAAVLFDTAFLD
jgi:hypothetical protein